MDTPSGSPQTHGAPYGSYERPTVLKSQAHDMQNTVRHKKFTRNILDERNGFNLWLLCY